MFNVAPNKHSHGWVLGVGGVVSGSGCGGYEARWGGG